MWPFKKKIKPSCASCKHMISYMTQNNRMQVVTVNSCEVVSRDIEVIHPGYIERAPLHIKDPISFSCSNFEQKPKVK